MGLDDCWDTLLINGVDVRDMGAYITNVEGLLANAPVKGDIIEQDWNTGGIWQQGSPGTYSFEVPLIMKSHFQDVAILAIRQFQGRVGTEVTLTRRLTLSNEGGTPYEIEEHCQAVMASAVRVVWDFEVRRQIKAVLVFQQLSGRWTESPPL